MNPGSSVRRSVVLRVLVLVTASMLLTGCYVGVPTVDLGALSALFVVVIAAAPFHSACIGMQQRRQRARRIVILGAGPMAFKLIEELELLDRRLYHVAGVVDDNPPSGPLADRVRWLGPTSQLADIVERERPSRIVVAVADRRDRLPLNHLLELRVHGVIVEDGLEFYERVTGKIAIEALNPSALILSSKGFRNHGAAEHVARVISLIAATIGLILTAPLLVAIAIAIKLTSKGPVLFVQQRAGRNGRPFGLLKFRTMHPSENRPSEWVRDNVNRITPIGIWLRRFRLDELPQLINVLKGEMNLVGPRPHPTSNHAMFNEHIAYYHIRSTVRPGVTGWAQVRYGYANSLEEETEKMRYDLFYIKNRSVWLDTRILLHTVGVVFSGEGASRVRKHQSQASAYPYWLVRPAPAPARTPAARD